MSTPFSLLHLVTAIGLLGTAATLVVPWQISEDILANEDRAAAFLRQLATEQQRRIQVPGAVRYATLAELLRAPRSASGSGLDVAEFDGDLARVDGYLVRVILADEEGRPTTASDRLDPAEAQRFFVAYAWPVAHGISGRSLFAIGPDGQLFRTENEIDPWSGPHRAPPAQLLGDRLATRALGIAPGWVDRVLWTPEI